MGRSCMLQWCCAASAKFLVSAIGTGMIAVSGRGYPAGTLKLLYLTPVHSEVEPQSHDLLMLSRRNSESQHHSSCLFW
jgi:hypothetical protein